MKEREKVTHPCGAVTLDCGTVTVFGKKSLEKLYISLNYG